MNTAPVPTIPSAKNRAARSRGRCRTRSTPRHRLTTLKRYCKPDCMGDSERWAAPAIPLASSANVKEESALVLSTTRTIPSMSGWTSHR